jgi:hypothetical protein
MVIACLPAYSTPSCTIAQPRRSRSADVPVSVFFSRRAERSAVGLRPDGLDAGSRLQLALDLVEEAPVSAIGDELLGVASSMPNSCH